MLHFPAVLVLPDTAAETTGAIQVSSGVPPVLPPTGLLRLVLVFPRYGFHQSREQPVGSLWCDRRYIGGDRLARGMGALDS